jgi:hypothetical protein
MQANRFIQKSNLTQQILDQLPGVQFPLEKTMRVWWANPNGGWALTDQGNYIFQKLNIEGHAFKLKIRTARFYVDADRAFHTPYYVERYNVILYGTKEATAVMITGGDIQQYLERYC